MPVCATQVGRVSVAKLRCVLEPSQNALLMEIASTANARVMKDTRAQTVPNIPAPTTAPTRESARMASASASRCTQGSYVRPDTAPTNASRICQLHEAFVTRNTEYVRVILDFLEWTVGRCGAPTTARHMACATTALAPARAVPDILESTAVTRHVPAIAQDMASASMGRATATLLSQARIVRSTHVRTTALGTGTATMMWVWASQLALVMTNTLASTAHSLCAVSTAN